jgi:glucose/mannose-6-phosphate isomerase
VPKELDPSKMMERVVGFPKQLRGAWDLAESGPDLLRGAKPSRVLVVGMGGSAIGGDFLRGFAEAESEVPVQVIRGYCLPRSARGNVHAFFVSYSGDTEETLSAWEEARTLGISRAAVTSGGELAKRASAEGMPLLSIPKGSPPRAALGWTAVPLLFTLGRAGLLPFRRSDLEAVAAACEDTLAQFGPEASEEENQLRAWASRAARRLPLIYAPEAPYAPAALRWACQMNENGKTLAHIGFFPEQNHNEIVAWQLSSPVLDLAEPALLSDDRIHRRIRVRMEIVAGILERSGSRVAWFEPRGASLPARLFSFAVMGDLASVYAAEAREVDPTPVPNIDRLKAELASR